MTTSTRTQTPQEILEVRDRLLGHAIYTRITSLRDLRVFMSSHVFAVWDFFSLAKRLQQLVTCVAVPWLPPADPTSARLINDIVLSEESDDDGRGGYASHFDLYREAMREIDADATAIDAYIDRLRAGEDAIAALDHADLPPGVDDFVRFDLTLATQSPPHQLAAAFCYGREDLIPEMFSELVKPLEHRGLGLENTRIKYYIDRHIILDSHEHAPLARRLVGLLCGDDERRRREATTAAVAALEARIRLWDGVLETLDHNGSSARD
jgi:hypothetical protein